MTADVLRSPRARAACAHIAALVALGAPASVLGAPPPPACPVSVAVSPSGKNIFAPEQEAALGDAVHEHLQGRYPAIDDEAVTAYPARIAQRLARQMPAGDQGFRILLWDIPVTEAISIPGGRIYLTRKLVASTRSEDELAAILAHEMGHALAHDSAVNATRLMQRRLGVTRVGDRADVFDKYHRLIEAAATAGGAPPDTHREQVAADRAAIGALACAGYRPGALAEWWDRLTETRGRTGSWLSDLMGTTRPEMKRLREMVRAQASPAAAVERPAADAAEFLRWQAAVVGYRPRALAEALEGLVWKRTLDPPLQPDVEHVRFSPDARFALAQDDAGIEVLSLDPAAVLFRIEAADAAPAQFSPDSRSVVFHTPGLRVEVWDIASKSRVSVNELARRLPCGLAALSPDGQFLACHEAGSRLVLIEVDGGSEVMEKEPFPVPSPRRGLFAGFASLDAFPSPIQFSPDGKYLLAGALQEAPLAFDLAGRAPLALPDTLRALTTRSFTFLGSDRVVGMEPGEPDHLVVARFPTGETISRVPLDAAARLAAASAGDYVLVRPLGKYAVAVIELATGKVVLGNRTPTLDVHGSLVLNETGDGGLDLRRWDAAGSARVSRVELPPRRLSGLRTVAASPDMKWLAASQRRRGAVWDLESGKRTLHVRGFQGASMKLDALYADFPAFDGDRRGLARLDMANGQMVERRPVSGEAVQLGDTMFTLGFDPAATLLEGTDVWSGARLWSRRMPAALFALFASVDGASIGLGWPVGNPSLRKEVERQPAAKAALASVKDPSTTMLLEVLDMRSGRTLGYRPLSSGVRRFLATDQWLAVEDIFGRVLAYSLATGELRGRLFATPVALSSTGALAAESRPGHVTVHDLATFEKRRDLVFSSAVAFARFQPDSQRLLVVGADQTAALLETGPTTGP